MTQIIPIFEMVLIRPEKVEATKSQSGLLMINTTGKEEIIRGTVIGLGYETKYLSIGDVVYYDKYICNKIHKDGEILHTILRKEVKCVERDEEGLVIES